MLPSKTEQKLLFFFGAERSILAKSANPRFDGGAERSIFGAIRSKILRSITEHTEQPKFWGLTLRVNSKQRSKMKQNGAKEMEQNAGKRSRMKQGLAMTAGAERSISQQVGAAISLLI